MNETNRELMGIFLLFLGLFIAFILVFALAGVVFSVANGLGQRVERYLGGPCQCQEEAGR